MDRGVPQAALDRPLRLIVEAIFTVKKTPKHCLGKTSALKNAFQTFNRLTVGEGLSQNIFTVKNVGLLEAWMPF